MTISQTMVTTPTVTTTGTLKRNVSDQIRRLNPVACPMLALVKKSGSGKMGEVSYSSGLIEKEATDTMKFEWFTLTPIDLYNTCSADGNGTTTFLVADSSVYAARDIVVNTNTLEVGIVVTASAGTVTVTAVSATFVALKDHVMALACNAHEEGSSSYTSRTQEPTNNYNFVFPFRFAVSVADTARNSPHYGENIVARYKKDNLLFCNRNVENGLILGNRAASGDTTSVTIGGTAYAMHTTRGVMDYAAVTYDAGGTMTYDKWNNDLFQKIPNTMDPEEEILMFCGKIPWTSAQGWVQSKFGYWAESGSEIEVFGKRAKKFMCGSYTITLILHDLMNHGGLAITTLLFNARDFKYRYKTGLDIQPKNAIQNPSVWGQTDEIRGVIGLQCWSGGANVLKIINWNN